MSRTSRKRQEHVSKALQNDLTNIQDEIFHAKNTLEIATALSDLPNPKLVPKITATVNRVGSKSITPHKHTKKEEHIQEILDDPTTDVETKIANLQHVLHVEMSPIQKNWFVRIYDIATKKISDRKLLVQFLVKFVAGLLALTGIAAIVYYSIPFLSGLLPSLPTIQSMARINIQRPQVTIYDIINPPQNPPGSMKRSIIDDPWPNIISALEKSVSIVGYNVPSKIMLLYCFLPSNRLGLEIPYCRGDLNDESIFHIKGTHIIWIGAQPTRNPTNAISVPEVNILDEHNFPPDKWPTMHRLMYRFGADFITIDDVYCDGACQTMEALISTIETYWNNGGELYKV